MSNRKSTSVQNQPEQKEQNQSEIPPEENTSLAVREEEDQLPERLSGISEESKEAIAGLLKKFSSKKRGFHADPNEGGGFKPQIVKIRQPMTGSAPENVKMGQLFTSNNESLGEALDIHPLTFWLERVKWPEGATVSERPECKSTDGEHGFWQQSEWRDCAPCLYKEWVPKESGDGKSKGYYPCKLTMNVIGISEDFSDFYRIQFAGANARIGRQFYNSIKSHKEIFDAVWRLSTEKQSGNPTYQYSKPSPVKKIKESDDQYVICDYFLDLIEEERARMQERQVQMMKMSTDLATEDNSVSGPVIDDDARPENFDM